MQKSILVLEENVMVHGLIESALSQGLSGVSVVHEQQKEQFLIKAREVNPDLILLSNADQQNDYATVKALKEDDQVGNVPVMLLTSARDELDEGYLEGLGIIGFLRKPFESSALQQQMQAVFQDIKITSDDDDAFNTDSSDMGSELDKVNLVDDDLLGMMGAGESADQMSMDDLEAELEPTRALEEDAETTAPLAEEEKMENYLEEPLDDEDEAEQDEVVGAMGFSADGEVSIGDLEEESDSDFMESTELPVFEEDSLGTDILEADEEEPLDMDLEEDTEQVASFEDHLLPEEDMDFPEFGDDMDSLEADETEESQIPASIQKMVSLKQVIKAHHVLSEKLEDDSADLEDGNLLEEIPLEDEMDFENDDVTESFVDAPDFDLVTDSEEFMLDDEDEEGDEDEAVKIPDYVEEDEFEDEDHDASVFGLDDLNVEDLSVEDPGLGLMEGGDSQDPDYLYLDDDTEDEEEEPLAVEGYEMEFESEDTITFDGLSDEAEIVEEDTFNGEELSEIYVEDYESEDDDSESEDEESFAAESNTEIYVEESLPEIELEAEELDFSDADIDEDEDIELEEDEIDISSFGELAEESVLPSMEDHMEPIDFSDAETESIEIDDVAAIDQDPLVEEIYHEGAVARESEVDVDEVESDSFDMTMDADTQLDENNLNIEDSTAVDEDDLLSPDDFDIDDVLADEDDLQLDDVSMNLSDADDTEDVSLNIEDEIEESFEEPEEINLNIEQDLGEPLELDENILDIEDSIEFDDTDDLETGLPAIEEVIGDDDMDGAIESNLENNDITFEESSEDEQELEDASMMNDDILNSDMEGMIADEFNEELESGMTEEAFESELDLNESLEEYVPEALMDEDISIPDHDEENESDDIPEVVPEIKEEEEDIDLADYGFDSALEDESPSQVENTVLSQEELDMPGAVDMVMDSSSFDVSGDEEPVMGLDPASEIAGISDPEKIVSKLSADVRTRLGAAIEEVISDTIQNTLHEMLPELMEKILKEELDDNKES